MPVITEVIDYNGVAARIDRLGLQPLYDQVVGVVTGWDLLIEETKHANGTKGIRELMDQRFEALGGWDKTVVGDIDWVAKSPQNTVMGVEVQVSGRSDLLIKDVLHVKRALAQGTLDVGIIIVPDDKTSRFLTDRTPNVAHARMHITEADASMLPIRVIGFSHDGPGPALSKMRTNLGRLKS